MSHNNVLNDPSLNDGFETVLIPTSAYNMRTISNPGMTLVVVEHTLIYKTCFVYPQNIM
jgi:hypothetical protein